MQARDKPLKGSGSYPAVSKLKVVRRYFSTSNILENKMKKLNRAPKRNKITDHSNRAAQIICKSAKNDRRNGDIFDYLPQRCVQVRPIVATRLKNDGASKKKPRRKMPILHLEYSPNSLSCSSVGSLHATKGDSRHIDVIVRIRPKNKLESRTKTVVFQTTESTLVFDPKEKNSEFYFKGKKQFVRNDFGRKRPNKDLAFGFDSVYGPESSNQEIFKTSLQGLIDHVLDGFNCTIFAYGATGSGKTFTMLGSNDTPGVTVLMAEELYRRLEGMTEDYSSEVTVSYLEVYNETIKDLLKPEKELYIRENGKQGIIIPELTIHKPRGSQELLRLLKAGNNARSQHATDLNSESSRSHAVFQIMVLLRQKSRNDQFKIKTSTSRLFMVDLAGSERGLSNCADGLRQREGANINKSLLALSNCINALADGKAHIPYRNSKLTRLLKDSLSGNCVTVMIANVSPSDLGFEDTHNTLHYANRAKNIKILCKPNCFSEELIEESTKTHIAELQDQILQLTSQLEDQRRMHNSLEDKMKECQMGMGDGISNVSSLPVVQAVSEGSVGRPRSVIHNPVAVDHFLELLTAKTKLMESFGEASVGTRLHEWEMHWKKLQVDVADLMGKLDVADPSFIALAKLKNTQSNLMAQFPLVASKATETMDKLTFVNDEIENVYQKYLKTLKLDQPFLTVTFTEFITHKKIETDLVTEETLKKCYQQLTETLFNDLMNSEIQLIYCLKFLRILYKLLKDSEYFTPEMNTNFQSIFAQVYNVDEPAKVPKNCSGRKISIEDDICNLNKTIYRSVINFPKNEPTLTRDSSTVLLDLKESSEIPPTTAGDPNNSREIETSCKDTNDSVNESSTEEQYQPDANEEYKDPIVQFYDPKEYKKQKNVHACSEQELQPEESATSNVVTDSGSCSSLPASGEMMCESVEELHPPKKNKLELTTGINKRAVKKRAPLGDKTSRISPGRSFLLRGHMEKYSIENMSIPPPPEPVDDDIETGMEVKISRTRQRNIIVRSGRAMTDITDIKTHRSEANPGSNKNSTRMEFYQPSESNGPFSPHLGPPSLMIQAHPIHDQRQPQPKGSRSHKNRPFTFMYKDTPTSTSSLEK